jgi:hypothetical protein
MPNKREANAQRAGHRGVRGGYSAQLLGIRQAPGWVLSGPGRRGGVVSHRSGCPDRRRQDQEQIVYRELISVQVQLTDDGMVPPSSLRTSWRLGGLVRFDLLQSP